MTRWFGMMRQTRFIIRMAVCTLCLTVAVAWGESDSVLAAAGAGGPVHDARALKLDDAKLGWQGAPRTDQFRLVAGQARGRESQVGELVLQHDHSASLFFQQPIDLSKYRALRFDVFVPKTHAHTHFAAYFVDEDSFWFQTWEPLVPVRDEWCTLEVDLRPAGARIESKEHGRPWGRYVARGVQEMGLSIFTDRPMTAKVGIDNVTLLPADDPTGVEGSQAILNFETSAAKVPCRARFEITFELSRCYENPYDPKQVEVWGVFKGSSGEVVRVPGFFYQAYARILVRKAERLIPAGAPQWKIRFAPPEVGKYTYSVEVNDGEVFKTNPAEFESLPSANSGCMRVCADDPRSFEFEDGTFFYPLGINLPATFNSKGARMLGLKVNQFEGSFAYDRFLAGMSRGKANYARIWLASWSFGLEWSRAYHPSYRGLGRYNQEHAWQLDHVLEDAERRGIYVQLALTTFGHWRAGNQFEGDWPASPYNNKNGGLLNHPQEFWRNEPAQEMYQRMVRYVMARWGYSTNIAAWELSNEIDLATGYPPQKKKDKPRPRTIEWYVDWHKRCVETIRKFDQNPHLVTTNFANWTNDPDLLVLPEIQFSSTNHYNVQILDQMRKHVFPLKDGYKKPAMMAECGYDFKGAMPETTIRYLHIGLWGSYMIPFAGNGLSWWWDFIDDRDLYPMFRPLAEFTAGEDRRRRNLKTTDAALHQADNMVADGLAALALQNDQGGYFWLYERRLLRAESDKEFVPQERTGLVLRMAGLQEGAYSVEFWDTRKGVPVNKVTVETKGDALEAPIPVFTSDLAGKVKFSGGAE